MKKQCSKCRRHFPLSGFSPDKRTILGVGSHCKACNRKRMQKYGKQRDVKRRRSAYNKLYRRSNGRILAEANRRWRLKNHRSVKAKQRSAYRRNKKTIIAWQRRNYRKNRAPILARQKRYYASRVAEHVERNRKWRAANPDLFLASLKHRRALKLGARESSLTADQWKAIKRRFKFRCAYCRRRRRLTQDHVIPLTRHGPHTRRNVVPACQSCNSSKSNKTVKEWKRHIKSLTKIA